MPQGTSRALVAVLACVVVGCASTPVAPPTVIAPGADEPFGVEGRLSAGAGRGRFVGLSWRTPPARRPHRTTPLGEVVAELSGDASKQRVEVRAADGRTHGRATGPC